MSAINRHKYFRNADGRVRRVYVPPLIVAPVRIRNAYVCAYVYMCMCVVWRSERRLIHIPVRLLRQDREQSRYNWTRGCRVTLKKKTPALIVPLRDEKPIDAIIVNHYRRSRNVVVKFLTEKSEKESEGGGYRYIFLPTRYAIFMITINDNIFDFDFALIVLHSKHC